MPKSAKFSRVEVISAAVEIVESKGVDGLTARELGKKLGSSSRPIFTVFKSMDEVFDGVFDYARRVYQSYVDKGLGERVAFKGVGKAYIKFASDRPELFRLLFMSERTKVPDVNSVLCVIDEKYGAILKSVTDSYPVDEQFAKRLYMHMWTYSHGIATLIVNRMCSFGKDEISDMLTDVCGGLLKAHFGSEK